MDIKQWQWLDLCSEIGAGFLYAGIKLWQRSPDYFCEKDKYGRGILTLRYPEKYSIPDFNGWIWSGDEKIDLITTSPPCQPFSIDGKRLGADDELDCFPAVLAVIAGIQPKFAVIESDSGLLSCPYRPDLEEGTYFRYLDWLLDEVGYQIEWHCISSKHFKAPWNRERLIIIAVARSLKLDWERATPWDVQIGTTIAEIENDFTGGSLQSERDADCIRTKPGAGVASGDDTNRDRRAALGNCLDWRVAAIGLKRVEYLASLI